MIHRRAGWVFVSGMTLVSITALLLAGARWATDPTPRGREAGAFLFFISILTATSVSGGVRVVVNANNLGLQTFSLVVWLTPSIIGVPAIVLWTRYYKRRFAPAARPSFAA